MSDSESDNRSSEDELGNEVEWEEKYIPEDAKCLFCAEKFINSEELYYHCDAAHNFNIISVFKLHRLDFYDYIKLINFIRKTTPSPDVFNNSYPHDKCPWASDDFLMPVITDDPLLCFDVENDLEKNLPKLVQSGSKGLQSEAESKNLTISYKEYNELLSELEHAKRQNNILSNQLENSLNDLKNLRSSSLTSQIENYVDPDVVNTSVSNVNAGGDNDYYFQSYDHYSIHEEMLKDSVRTLAYQEAILKNAALVEKKNVLDVGCGSSILSMFMATAGAASVIAVDQSDIVFKAMDIVRENRLENVINCVKGRIEDLNHLHKVDIIVSEWMGYFLLFESMLESVLHARNKYLKNGGIMMPNKCQILLGGFSDPDMQANRIDYWGEVYGYSMKVLRDDILKEAQVDVLKEDTIVTNECCIYDLDLMTCKSSDIDHSATFTLNARKDTTLTGLYSYFTTTFDLPHQVVLSTSPSNKATHWKQTLFLFSNPLVVKEGRPLCGTISWKRNEKVNRSIDIKINIEGGKTYKYFLD